MTRREAVLTPVDIELLGALQRGLTLADACAQLGVRRDRGAYRLRRMTRAARAPVVATRRGGRSHGETVVTATGRALLRKGAGHPISPGVEATEARVQLRGTWRAGAPPTVRTRGGLSLAVAFVAEEGQAVEIVLDAEAVLIALERFPTSARNVLDGTVVRIVRGGPGTSAVARLVQVRVGRTIVGAAATDGAIEALGLRRGRRVVLYVKATAVRRVDAPRRSTTRGSRRP